MARRSGSHNEQFQRRVPADVLKVARGRKVSLSLSPETVGGTPIPITVTLRDELRFSLRTLDKTLGDLRRAAVMQQLAQAYAAILKAHREGPCHLSQKQCHALAGIIYRAFADSLEDDPSNAELWAYILAENDHALTGPLPGLSIADTPEEQSRIERLAILDRRFGPFVDAVLLREGVICDEDSRNRLLFEFARAMSEAAAKLKRNAEGDYSPDPVAARFPKWDGIATTTTPAPSSALTFDHLLTRWQNEGDKAPGSVVAFRAAVASLIKHLGHNDPVRVTKADIRSWRDALLTGDRTAKTVNDSYITHIRTLYRLGKREDLLNINPAEDVYVQEKRVAGKGAKVYTDGEVAALLSLADKETAAYLHWMPWLLALTGARVSEIAQLWGKHVKPIDGIPAISITPTEDGGRLKNHNSERDVPLHPALIDRGFLEFVKARGSGPLFYGGKAATPRPRRDGQVKHAAKGTANHLREWIRKSGFTDRRKAPCHAFRHWFKTKCTKLKIDGDIIRAIQGHAGEGADAPYQHIGEDLAALHEALSKIPVPTLDAAAALQPRESTGGTPNNPHASDGGHQ